MAIAVRAPRQAGLSGLACMSGKSDQRAAVEVVAAYQEARLVELAQRGGDCVDRFRAGRVDAFEADQVIFQHSRAAKEMWKFCYLSDA